MLCYVKKKYCDTPGYRQNLAEYRNILIKLLGSSGHHLIRWPLSTSVLGFPLLNPPPGRHSSLHCSSSYAREGGHGYFLDQGYQAFVLGSLFMGWKKKKSLLMSLSKSMVKGMFNGLSRPGSCNSFKAGCCSWWLGSFSEKKTFSLPPPILS